MRGRFLLTSIFDLDETRQLSRGVALLKIPQKLTLRLGSVDNDCRSFLGAVDKITRWRGFLGRKLA